MNTEPSSALRAPSPAGGRQEAAPRSYEPVLPEEGPRLGAEVRFVPGANLEHVSNFSKELMAKVTGTIIQIHEEHRWYRVAFILGSRPGCIGHECFKF